MSGDLPPTAPRFPLRTIQAMDEIAREFRRKLRDHVIRLSSRGGGASVAAPDAVLEALPLACGELVSEAEMVDERGVDGK